MAIFAQAGNETGAAAIEKQMRALAMRLQADSFARLPAVRGCEHAMRAIGRKIRRITEESESIAPATEWICDNIRIMEKYCLQVHREKSGALPACGRRPRIAIAAAALIADGDVHMDREMLMHAVQALDDVQPLTMEEIWSVPSALRGEICRAFISAADRILAEEEARLAAQKWINAGADAAKLAGRKRTDAFFARAIQIMGEREMAEARTALKVHLSRADTDAGKVIRIANERQAIEGMRMANLLDAMRMLDRLDWQEAYMALSRAEKELLRDPSGAYPRMEEASKQAIRRQVQMLAKRMELGEATIVSHAVEAACEYSDRRKCICRWLYEDEGIEQLKEKLNMCDIYTPPVIPDPKGEGYITAVLLCSLAAWFIFACSVGNAAFALLGIPVAWYIGAGIVGWIFPKVICPRPLLKLKLEKLPEEAATLVTIPALLTSAKRAEALAEQLEVLGCTETDENLAFLLLGDFADAKEAHMPGDEEILEAVRKKLAKMNADAGREKYFFLHRERTLCVQDGIWMGYERKRGALMALYRLLLGGENGFLAEGECAEKLKGRYRYVLTLDADTRMLPGTAHRLAGTILHPLNRFGNENGMCRGYALIQPRMENSLKGGKNEFVRRMAGVGGMDSYPVSVSDVYQDLTGQGIFGGKGIVDVEAFFESLSGRFPEHTVLSHDLIEGIYAGAGYASDIVLYDSFPATPGGYLRRLERWTRGDWQLLRFIPKRDISALDRYKLLDNLRRSMTEPSALALLLLGLWFASPSAIVMGLMVPALPMLLYPGAARGMRSIIELGFLPMRAGAQLAAAIRAIYRSFISGKKLLEWVPSAEAEGNMNMLAAGIAALLLLPAAVHLPWVLFAAALAGLFLLMPGYLRGLSEPEAGERPSEREREFLQTLAEDTWKFFAEFTENGLPPDNVQMDPPMGSASRTSPTNIGLYLVSCLCAKLNGTIEEKEMLLRMKKTMDALEKMPKWKGHPYNWHDIHTLEALPPRYVSSVDSGNLLACLLLCAEAVGGEIGMRMREFCTAMDFGALYDEKRDLFVIGADVEQDKLSSAHYDLLASESRILSYATIMLGKIPVKHYLRLGRGTTGGLRKSALISWSGTMFEYLMPELFLRAEEGSLLCESNRNVIRAQRRMAKKRMRPWGISESGYYEFDRSLNYQYRAFGMRELALSGSAQGEVVAPYASALALPYALHAACENLLEMSKLGWRGEFGMYEAVDFDSCRVPEDAGMAVVCSYMSHHQGMLLAAVTNALHADILADIFARQKEAKAISLLLEEKPSEHISLRRRHPAAEEHTTSGKREYPPRHADGKTWLDTHILGGAGATAVFGATGEGFYRKNGILVNRWTGDPIRKNEGIFLHVEESGTMKAFSAGGQRENAAWLSRRVQYEPGNASYFSKAGALECRLDICISPENGMLVQELRVKNISETGIRVRATNAFTVALMNEAELMAHPAFYGLFVQSERVCENALRFVRRKRSAEESFPVLMHAVASDLPTEISCETDLSNLIGREGDPAHAGGISREFTGTVGSVLNPCSALRAEVRLEAGEEGRICFYVDLCREEEAEEWLLKNGLTENAQRARQLSKTQAIAALRYMKLKDPMHRLLQRAAALLVNVRSENKTGRMHPVPIRNLWALGISGDLPIFAVHIASKEELPLAKDALRAHEFYHMLGLWTDLILINEYGNDYDQPVRDGLCEMIRACPLREWEGKAGGIHRLEGNQLSKAAREVICTAAAIEMEGSEGSFAHQLQGKLSELKPPKAIKGVPAPGDGFILPEIQRDAFNGYGGFAAEGYCVDVLPCTPTPAPWVNILANSEFGTLISERGGGFTWYKNSRNGRITPFENDPLREGWGERIYITEGEEYFSAIPGPKPNRAYRTLHAQGYSEFLTGTEEIQSRLTIFVEEKLPIKWFLVQLWNRGIQGKKLSVQMTVDWLMGVGIKEKRSVRTESVDGAVFAVGTMEGCAFAAGLGEKTEAEAGVSKISTEIPAGETVQLAFAVGCAENFEGAKALLASVRGMDAGERLESVKQRWARRLDAIRIQTPDAMLNAMLGRYLPYQAWAGRIWGRAGLYQAGGAYGFRDQLQDMLLAMLYEPKIAREHILFCAAHQFEDGDVMHWWHPNFAGVRTRITDDMLFLPFVTEKYVEYTGDRAILDEKIAYLKNVDIPEGREDWYGEAEISETEGTLTDHCLRAIYRAYRKGEHGLLLMGTGDWNDGMNRIGARGKGESVWLTQFMSVVARNFGALTKDAALLEMAEELKQAIEAAAWDGQWYLRAYDDAGNPVGGGARIDAIAQSWAVFSELDRKRTHLAMESVKKNLIDWDEGIVRLLTPPFDGECDSIGYIAGYVPGVRENGGQYTHAACWTGIALAELGQAEEAWKVLKMLMPYSHSDSPKSAQKYKAEPYVVAADVYSVSPHTGRGGWTWYTGAAGWMVRFALMHLLGYERHGNRAALHALLPEGWNEVRITVRVGNASYELISRRGAAEREAVELIDDGRRHVVLFPAKNE